MKNNFIKALRATEKKLTNKSIYSVLKMKNFSDFSTCFLCKKNNTQLLMIYFRIEKNKIQFFKSLKSTNYPKILKIYPKIFLL